MVDQAESVVQRVAHPERVPTSNMWTRLPDPPDNPQDGVERLGASAWQCGSCVVVSAANRVAGRTLLHITVSNDARGRTFSTWRDGAEHVKKVLRPPSNNQVQRALAHFNFDGASEFRPSWETKDRHFVLEAGLR